MDLKKPIGLIVASLMIFSLFSIALVSTQGMEGGEEVGSSPDDRLLGYTSHSPIRIDGNDEFANSTAVSNPGAAGNATDPYIIEGYDIDGGGHGYCIYIGNTTKHFVVRDCYLHNASGSFSWPYYSSSGLTLQNITDGVIEDNNISFNNGEGIYVNMSNNNRLIKNNITQNGMNGMLIESSAYSDISNNTVNANNNVGIALFYSVNNIINNNNILNNSGGLGVGLESDNNIIYNNIASYNYNDGFQIYYSDGNSIYNNVASSNGGDGLYIISKNSTIEGNEIYNNSERAIEYRDSSNCTINQNILSNNTEGIYLYDSKETNILNNIIYNSTYAIQQIRSNYVSILNNSITPSNKSIWGIKMDNFSEGNTIEENTFSSNTSFYQHRWDEGLVAPYDDPTGISNASDYWEYLANASYTEFINISTNTTFEYHIMGWEDAPDLDLGIYYDNNSDNKAQTEELVEYCADGDSDEIVTIEYTKPGTYIAKVAGYEVDGSEGNFNRSLTLGNMAMRILGRGHTISYNTISGYGAGIVADGTVQCILDRNTVADTNTSIHISNVNDTKITKNHLSNNTVAINIENSTDNEFYHNSFMNNSNHIYSSDNTSYSNIWDDGEGKGNYWDDYTGADDGSGGRTAGDGIGDTERPHPNTDEGHGYYQLDNYPIMGVADNEPPVISSVGVQNITETTVNITWKTDESTTSKIVYSTNPDLTSNMTKSDVSFVENHSVSLTNLSIGAEYYFKVISEDVYGNIAVDENGSDYYFFVTLDLTPPKITSVSIMDIKPSSATISWITDEPSDSRVNYSTYPDLSSNSTVYNSTLTTTHSIELNDLTYETTYYFEVFSTDEEGNRAKDDNESNYYSFKTLFNDTIPPEIFDLTTGTPTTGEQFSLIANVTDDVGIASVMVEYWYDNGLKEEKAMSKYGNSYLTTIKIPNSTDDLNYVYRATDVNENVNETSSFTKQIVDDDPPSIDDFTPKTGTTGDPFIFNFSVSDNIGVSDVFVDYWFGSNRSDHINKSLDHHEDNIWSKEITIPSSAEEDLYYDVKAVDEGGNWAYNEDIRTSIFDNDPPTAEAGEDVEVYIGTTVKFNASGSTDNTGILRYEWTSEDISNFSMDGITPSYKFEDPGTYNISLTVTDLGGNTDSDELVVTVSSTKDTDDDGIPDEEDSDADGDGMNDTWEIEHGLDPEDRYDSVDDPDNDNLTNVEEYNKGTDPMDPDTDGDGVPDGYDLNPLDSEDDDDDEMLPWWFFVMIAAISAVLVFFFIRWYSERSEEDELQELEDEEKEIED